MPGTQCRLVWPASVHTWSGGTRTLGCSKLLEGENKLLLYYIYRTQTLAILEILRIYSSDFMQASKPLAYIVILQCWLYINNIL